MRLKFFKMHGAGNDFIVADDSSGRWSRDIGFIKASCDRRRGVGADGLILLSSTEGSVAVRMDFYNCDGSEAGLCGNGLRCAAEFARMAGLAKGQDILFDTKSGRLSAKTLSPGMVRISMPITEQFVMRSLENGCTVYKGAVGVPHAVVPVTDLRHVDVPSKGAFFRWHPAFAPEGANVNFMQIPASFDEPVSIRTYERGVEGETLACGTGAASAAACLRKFFSAPVKIKVLSAGGDILDIELIEESNILKGMLLAGPAAVSFEGSMEVEAPRKRNGHAAKAAKHIGT